MSEELYDQVLKTSLICNEFYFIMDRIMECSVSFLDGFGMLIWCAYWLMFIWYCCWISWRIGQFSYLFLSEINRPRQHATIRSTNRDSWCEIRYFHNDFMLQIMKSLCTLQKDLVTISINLIQHRTVKMLCLRDS